MATLTKLKKLSPTAFENMTYDLLFEKGMQNLSWRTPGADGGRDIEAELFITDISGSQYKEKWYVECKRYTSSVDWPTIFGKLSYAESNRADFLLMCTTSSFSPNAMNEVSKWNLRKGSTKIRLWPGHEIEHQLRPFRDLQTKYGILPAPTAQGDKLTCLSNSLSKSIQTAYGEMAFRDERIPIMLESAQNQSILIQQRLSDLDVYGEIRVRRELILSTPFAKASGGDCFVDRYAYDAITSYLYALSGQEVDTKVLGENKFQIELSSTQDDIYLRYSAVFNSMTFWGDIELSKRGRMLVMTQRV